mmetsp:Transcript_95244/g.273062  ORF Transcript_95244/g.273062 Transcript_95244/m.273062 type:complete len:215 (-) Transcript_95244:109-753(-)
MPPMTRASMSGRYSNSRSAKAASKSPRPSSASSSSSSSSASPSPAAIAAKEKPSKQSWFSSHSSVPPLARLSASATLRSWASAFKRALSSSSALISAWVRCWTLLSMMTRLPPLCVGRTRTSMATVPGPRCREVWPRPRPRAAPATRADAEAAKAAAAAAQAEAEEEAEAPLAEAVPKAAAIRVRPPAEGSRQGDRGGSGATDEEEACENAQPA